MTHVDQPFKLSPTSPAHSLKLASAHPGTRILAAHMGGMLGTYTGLPAVRSALDNIWFDTALSATLYMVRFYAERGLVDKIVFGSDFPFNHSHSQAQVVQGLRELGLGQEIKAKIFSENFAQLSS